MGRSFSDRPYLQLTVHDFGPGGPYRVSVEHNGQAIVIGNIDADLSLQDSPKFVIPDPGIVDIHVHGVPGRFVQEFSGEEEIPVKVLVELLETQGGLPRGTPLRLLTCHAGEACAPGVISAQILADQWGGCVFAPDGRLDMDASGMKIHLVEWSSPWSPDVIGLNQGQFLEFVPLPPPWQGKNQ
jgi:hypothetical protein